MPQSGQPLLHQNIPHSSGIPMNFVVAAGIISIVSTCIQIPQGVTKSYKGVAVIAVVLVVSDQTDSYPAPSWRTSVKPFLVTAVWFQGGGRPNKGHPIATTEMGGSVMPIRDQWVKGWGLHVNYNKSNVVVDLHSQADLWEICAPVPWQLGLSSRPWGWRHPGCPSSLSGIFCRMQHPYQVSIALLYYWRRYP